MCIPYIFARQRLRKNVTAATNTHATEEMQLQLDFRHFPSPAGSLSNGHEEMLPPTATLPKSEA
jgi:hypothetical protein